MVLNRLCVHDGATFLLLGAHTRRPRVFMVILVVFPRLYVIFQPGYPTKTIDVDKILGESTSC